MNKHQLYTHRQEILRTQDADHIKVAMVIADRIDWNNNKRFFRNQDKFRDWLSKQCPYYGIEEETMFTCMADLIHDGYFKVINDDKGVLLIRTLPPGVEK